MGTARFVLGLDLDGVVADLHAGLEPVAAELRSLASALDTLERLFITSGSESRL